MVSEPNNAPSSRTSTRTTPRLSVAEKLTLAMPLAVDLAAGEAIDATGDVVSVGLPDPGLGYSMMIP